MSDIDARTDRVIRRWTAVTRAIDVAFALLFAVIGIFGFATRNPWWLAVGMFCLLMSVLTEILNELQKLNRSRKVTIQHGDRR